MSSAERHGISVDVDHNPHLAEGAGTLDAIISIAAGSGIATTVEPPQRVEAIQQKLKSGLSDDPSSAAEAGKPKKPDGGG